MRGRIGFMLAALVALAAVVAGTIGSATAGAVTAPAPSISSLVLATADLRPGAVVSTQRATTVEGMPFYLRSFKPGARVGSATLLGVVSLVVLHPDASTAAADLSSVEGAAQTAAGRMELANAWALAFVKGANTRARGTVKLVVKRSVVGKPIALGPEAIRLPLTLTTNHGTLRLALGFVQTDRALGIVELLGWFGKTLPASDVARATAAERKRLADAFTVRNSAPPVVSGSAVQGQVLSLDEGTWTGAPSTFQYAWSRCDAAGATCTPIDGATGRTYTVAPADAGSTLRVAVTGLNSVSSQQALSAPTAPVT